MNFGFAILDFGLGEKNMNKKRWMRWRVSSSDNLKSKIQNRKLAGLVTLVIAFVICGVAAEAQQPGENSPDRVSDPDLRVLFFGRKSVV